MAVTDDAISQIKEMLASGRFNPGDKLPPEKALSLELGVSRSSLREVIRALELIKVLDVRQGDGTYVTSLDPAMLIESMSFFVDLRYDASIIELFQVRRILEPAAAKIAVTKITDEEIAELFAMVEDATTVTTVDEMVAHDLAFHSKITAISGNRYLLGVLDSLSNNTHRARIWRGVTQEDSAQTTLNEHKAIVVALQTRDAELVHAVVLAHIGGIEQWLKKAI